jgi:hypothetical protein
MCLRRGLKVLRVVELNNSQPEVNQSSSRLMSLTLSATVPRAIDYTVEDTNNNGVPRDST